ncbi:PEP-CTERM motif protein [Geobacter sp. OR-1]|uniref:PEP-CTERM sorting domain-containing protein n=1 Tax=Geobacter sp. OR-1 TaxID=1266765 RepID=UPI0005429906|nr:PEP-CTERM sorting domain-containing protein [Geobacter sp. OR-1]GAM10606.1 PEP-CTERM motif protein [Geobacter sp. OR-1]
MKKMIALLAGLMMMGSTAAIAAPILDFGLIAPTSGSISYAGGIAPLVGSNIDVNDVVLLDENANQIGPRYSLLGAVLDFTSGNFVSGSNTTANFGGGPNSTITLSGTVDVNGNNIVDDGDITGIILSGNFGNAQVITTFGVARIAGAAFNDYKNPALLDLYNLPEFLPNTEEAMPYLGSLNLSFNANDVNLADGFRSAALLSGDLTNTPVPEPGTIALLGAGLLGLGIYGRRRAKK